MGYETLIGLRVQIKAILNDKSFLNQIEDYMKMDKHFLNISFLEFRRALSYISSITEEEYYVINGVLSKNGSLIEEVYDYIVHLDKCRRDNIFDESYIAVATINFMDTVKEIKSFVDAIRLDKMNKRREVETQLEESKRILEEIEVNKQKIESIYNSISNIEKNSSSAVIRLQLSEDKIKELVEYASKQKAELEKLSLSGQASKAIFDKQLQDLIVNKDKLSALIDDFDTELKKKINKRMEAYENDLQDSARQFSEQCSIALIDNEEFINNKRDELLKKLSEEQTIVVQNIEAFKVKVLRDLREIESSVYREKLARYFYDERRKLKGDININLVVASIAFFVMYWRGELFKNYITDSNIIVKLVISYFGFFVLAQILFNIHDNYTFKEAIRGILELINIKKRCLTFFEECLNSDESKYKDISPKSVGFMEKVFSQKQIRDLLTPYWCWLAATFTGMASIGYLALKIYYEFEGKPVVYTDFLPFTAGYMLLIWVTWFCSKQFSYTKQICDEYEYKYALSKSYISYREEAKKLADARDNVAIMISLLDSIIKNIAQSPVQSVKRDCHTPFTEVFNAVKDAGKACNGVKDNDKLND